MLWSEVPFNVVKLFRVATVLLLTSSPTLSGYSWSTTANTPPTTKSLPVLQTDHNLGLSPVFDDLEIRQVNAVEGQTVLLPCTIRNLGDKVVSWIRSKDLHILTSGPFTFSSDNRFEAVTTPLDEFWGLRLRGVHKSDSGQYECQVNTDPKMSLALNLSVSGVGNLESTNSKWVGQALIKGPNKVYVQDGSPVSFTCEILPVSVASLQSGAHRIFMTAKPKVRWLHDNKEILFDSASIQSRITMETWYSELDHKVIGKIAISKVSWRDGGQYTCFQMSVKPDNVKLYVSQYAEHLSEAMQGDFPIFSTGSHYRTKSNNILVAFCFLFLVQFPT